jgi:hypothetical protein
MKLTLLKISGAVLALSLVALEIAAQSGGGFPSRPKFLAVGVGTSASSSASSTITEKPTATGLQSVLQLNDFSGTGNGIFCINDTTTCAGAITAHDFALATAAGFDVQATNGVTILAPTGAFNALAVRGSATNPTVLLSGTAGNPSYISFTANAVSGVALVGADGAAAQLCGGSTAGDLCIRDDSTGKINFGTSGTLLGTVRSPGSSIAGVSFGGGAVAQAFDATLAAGGVTVNNSSQLGTVAGTRSGAGIYQITYTAGVVTRAHCTQRSNGGIPAVIQIESLGSGVININTFTLAGGLSDVTGSWMCTLT